MERSLPVCVQTIICCDGLVGPDVLNTLAAPLTRRHKNCSPDKAQLNKRTQVTQRNCINYTADSTTE